MIVITFPDSASQKKALGFLLGRFTGKVLKNGENIVSEAAVAALALMALLAGITWKLRSLRSGVRPGQIHSLAVLIRKSDSSI